MHAHQVVTQDLLPFRSQNIAWYPLFKLLCFLNQKVTKWSLQSNWDLLSLLVRSQQRGDSFIVLNWTLSVLHKILLKWNISVVIVATGSRTTAVSAKEAKRDQ